MDMSSKLFTKVDNGTEERTGYKLNDLTDYVAFATELLIAADDALLNEADFDEVYDDLFDRVNGVFAKGEDILYELSTEFEFPANIETALSAVNKVTNIYFNVEPSFKELVANYYDCAIDDNFIEDVIEVLEKLAVDGFASTEIPTTDETVLDKYEVQMGNHTITVSRYLEF